MWNELLWSTNQKYWAALTHSLRSIYYTLFMLHRVAVPSATHHQKKNMCNYVDPKLFFLSQNRILFYIFWLFHDHIVSTTGDALIMSFAMEHMKCSHLWWFLCVFSAPNFGFSHQRKSLPEFLLYQAPTLMIMFLPKIWFGLVWFHLAQRDSSGLTPLW
jgi:hypothetical protein